MVDEKTQDSGKEQEVKDPVDEESDLFSANFKEASSKSKGPDPQEKEEEGDEEDGKSIKDSEKEDGEGKEGEKDDEKKVKEEGKGKEGPAKAILDARAKRLQEIMTQPKEKKDEKQVQKGKKGPVADETGDDEPPEEGKGSDDEGEEEEDEGDKKKSGPSSLLKGIKFTKDEQEYIEDEPESVSIAQKLAKKMVQEAIGGELTDMKKIVDAQSEEIATLRTEIVITKLVPEYEEIIFDGDKVDEKGERIQNPVFWGWLEKQPKLTQALAFSYNPYDNAAVLKAFKEEQAKEIVKEKDEKSRNTLKKVQDLHGYTPTTKKTARRTTDEPSEDDFDSHFHIAAAQKAKK